MDERERLGLIRDAIKNALERGEDFVTVTNPETGKFVQFAIFPSKGLIVMDIPLIELSDNEREDLMFMLDTEVAKDPVSRELVSVQKLFNLDEAKELPRKVENIFLEVFLLPESYEIQIDIFPR
jgi:hypothetical protein